MSVFGGWRKYPKTILFHYVKCKGKLFATQAFIANSEKCFWASDGNRTCNRFWSPVRSGCGSISVWGSETFFWVCDKSLSSKQFSFNSPSCKSSSYIYIDIYVKWSYNAELFRLNIYTVINATWLDLKQYFLFGVPDTKPLHFYIMVSLIQIVYFLTLSHPEAL